ncbi:MAG: hypothetical protein AAF493_21190 [Pseudomonadota bacterium]
MESYELRAAQDGWYLVMGEESIGPLESQHQAEKYLELLNRVSGARIEIAWGGEDYAVSAEPLIR